LFEYDKYSEILLKGIDTNVSLSERSRIVFHVFSQNGSWTFGTLLSRLLSIGTSLPSSSSSAKLSFDVEEFLNKVDRVIFDSAPIITFTSSIFQNFTIADGYSRAMVPVILKREQSYRWLYTPLVMGYFLLHNLFTNSFQIANDRVSHILKLKNTTQFLVFYSSADEVVPSEWIDQFVEDRKKNNYLIQAIKWVDSPHVKHFLVHQEEYTKEIQQFILHHQEQEEQSQS
jgi:hypothetical protein